MKSTNNNSRGFTLIEIIIALMIFSIVAVVSLGALTKIINANKKAQSIQAGMTNLNFALDSISREMRVGTKFYCDQWNGGVNFNPNNQGAKQCSRGGEQNTVISFLSSTPGVYSNDSSKTCKLGIAYFVEEDNTLHVFTISKAEQTHCGDNYGDNGAKKQPIMPLVSGNMTISGYNVVVTNDPFQRILLRLTGYAGTREQDKTDFDVQTSVSARLK